MSDVRMHKSHLVRWVLGRCSIFNYANGTHATSSTESCYGWNVMMNNYRTLRARTLRQIIIKSPIYMKHITLTVMCNDDFLFVWAPHKDRVFLTLINICTTFW